VNAVDEMHIKAHYVAYPAAEQEIMVNLVFILYVPKSTFRSMTKPAFNPHLLILLLFLLCLSVLPNLPIVVA
jgi:hypothetical protein